jgi:nitrogen regulatory protein P-II 1
VVELHRGIAYAKTLLPKLELEVVVRDGDLMEAVLAIAHSAHTGKVGGGKILVSPVERAVRVRTGERGDAALA